MVALTITLDSETDTLELGARICRLVEARCLIFLRGQLGVGKTTLVRGYLRAAGHRGVVKSPTYTLVEEYFINEKHVYHFDFYRLADPEELEWIGIRDYLSGEAVCLVEWPEQGRGILPPPDLQISLATDGKGRTATVEGFGDLGTSIAAKLRG